ncbi:MAG: hypothetical protein M1812_000134 [Candelaria pacifica]|nr:MAG: hypothetical protein M1812_000134 [Candelaria pacifica]
MANDQDNNLNRPNGTQDNVISHNIPTSNNMPSVGEEDLTAEVDEPPDKKSSSFGVTPVPNVMERSRRSDYSKSTPPRFDRRESLLTRALMTDSELSSHDERPKLVRPTRAMSTASDQSTVSTISTVELTSDGGITSPARTDTPSPPLPQTAFAGLDLLGPKGAFNDRTIIGHDGKEQTSPSPQLKGTQETAVEAGLGRRRCISFACGRNARSTLPTTDAGESKAESHATDLSHTPAATPKRACMLKFVCPTRASKQAEPSMKDTQKSRLRSPPPANGKFPSGLLEHHSRTHRDSDSTVRETPPKGFSHSPNMVRSRNADFADYRHSEATRFHEFASSVDEVDEWIYESTVHRHKMTIGDTLKKENAIRQLGEEAEEEALQDEEQQDEDDEENEDEETEEDDGDDEEQDNMSDLGNETDNEAGFADSDDESDTRSDYQFWTPGGTTAATSTDYIEHIRPTVPRVASDSSLETTYRKGQLSAVERSNTFQTKRAARRIKIRPGTPDLPDSTDFVCGTLDEDRPLEQAYVSCLMERKRSKHTIIPQDIDPSFPTSDFEDEDENDDVHHSEDNLWIKGQLDGFEDGANHGRIRHITPHRKSPFHSPKRLRSPAPFRRGTVHRSPPPARGHKSPPPTRRVSLATSPKHQVQAIDFTPLSRRPNLTHTKSLPRHSNPSTRCSKIRVSGLDEDDAPDNSPNKFDCSAKERHNRGAIDIVKGLENKRQRRKEKQMLKHCRNNGKERWRKPQPGKGAERMRELGLEMAGKGKGAHGQEKAQYMLSI